MSGTHERTRVLITVMTYPHLSRQYTELVCTAGITDQHEWVRLYPIDYRYRPFSQRFHKYQWIEVDLDSRGANNDVRKESRRPDVNSIRLIGGCLSTENQWAERRAIIDAMPHYTVSQLEKLYEREKVSLGIVRPKRVIDIEIEEANPEWKPEWQSMLCQLNLFEGAPKGLRKIPYVFRYVFECEDDSRPRRAMIEDWELGVLFLNEAERLGSELEACRSVKNKYLNEICNKNRDVRFFMGTTYPYNTWLVLGVFWPPVRQQMPLFD